MDNTENTPANDGVSAIEIDPTKYGFELIEDNESIKTYRANSFDNTIIQIVQTEGNIVTIQYGWLPNQHISNDCAFRYKCETVEQFEFVLFNSGISEHLKFIKQNA